MPGTALIALLLPSAFGGTLLINEVVYDPAGSDTGFEWVEICNGGSSTVDLTGYRLENAGTSWAGRYTFPSFSLAPGSYVVVGAGSVGLPGSGFSTDLQNGGGTTADGLRLVSAGGAVLDTLIYGATANDNGLLDDTGLAATSVAAPATNGKGLARRPDCTDTDASGADFAVVDAAGLTPGAANPSGGGGGGDTCENTAVEGIVINEFLPNPDWADGTADDAREWVELYNASGTVADLSGWKIEYGTSPDDFDGSTKEVVLPEGTVLLPGDFLLVGGADVPGLYGLDLGAIDFIDTVAIGEPDIDMGTASSNADGVRLVDCAGTAVDTIIYGHKDGTDGLAVNTDGFVDDTGAVAGSLAPKGNAGVVIGRLEDGLDSDLSFDDFAAMPFPTPGYSNTTEPDCPGIDDLKLNEVMVAPEGGGTAGEWVEITNVGGAAVDLNGWQLGFATSGGPAWRPIEGSFVVPAGGHFVIGGGVDVPNVSYVLESISLGNATSNADYLGLRHPCGLVADTLVYGPTILDGETGEALADWADDSGAAGAALEGRLAPTAGEAASIARCEDGVDTDDNAADWGETAAPSPGAANPALECEPPLPPRCEAGTGTVKINELYPNPEGTDTGQEFIELYNAGSSTVALDGWAVQYGTQDFTTDKVIEGNVDIAPGEYLLLGGPEGLPMSLSLGNASGAPDGVRLVDCQPEGTDPVVQDTVLYAEAGDPWEDIAFIDDAGGQSTAPLPEEGRSLGRVADGADSDDNTADFASMAPTPGRANTLDAGDGAGSDGGGDDGGKGTGGCGGEKDIEGRDTGPRCASAGGARGWLLVGLALVAGLRRRRGGPGAR